VQRMVVLLVIRLMQRKLVLLAIRPRRALRRRGVRGGTEIPWEKDEDWEDPSQWDPWLLLALISIDCRGVLDMLLGTVVGPLLLELGELLAGC
jgi:hypothetical protein